MIDKYEKYVLKINKNELLLIMDIQRYMKSSKLIPHPNK
jgi:hypothetical protein